MVQDLICCGQGYVRNGISQVSYFPKFAKKRLVNALGLTNSIVEHKPALARHTSIRANGMVKQLLKEYSNSRGLKVGLIRAASQKNVISEAVSPQENVVNADEDGKINRKASIRRTASQQRIVRKRSVYSQSAVSFDEGKVLRLRAGLSRTASQRRSEVSGAGSQRESVANIDEEKLLGDIYLGKAVVGQL